MRGAGTEMQKGAIEKIVNVIGFVNVANCEPSSMTQLITDQKSFTSTEKNVQGCFSPRPAVAVQRCSTQMTCPMKQPVYPLSPLGMHCVGSSRRILRQKEPC